MSRNALGARMPTGGAEPARRLLPDGSESMHHGGSFGAYMAHKINKLGEQFAEQQAGQQRTDLFGGVGIYVDGFTTPSHLELKRLMALHGGSFHNYYSRSAVTHIICSNLPDSKVKQLARERNPTPIVRPEWVVESIKQGRLLPILDYALYQLRDAPGQQKLKAFQPVRSSELPDSALYGSHAGAVGEAVAAAAQEPPAAAGTGGGQQGLAPPSGDVQQQQQQQQQQQAPPPCSPLAAARSPSPAAALPARPRSSAASPSAAAAAPHGGVASAYDPDELRRAHEIASRMRAECDMLKGPPKSTKDDPHFAQNYWQASRLHFIGTWRTRFQSLMESLSGEVKGPSPVPYGPGRLRTIIHLDMDCFFASVTEASVPEFKGKPLAVCHSASAKGSGEVSTSNYEARKYGVRSGMFISTAKELCPHLVVVPYLFDLYEEATEKVYRILLNRTAGLQPLSCDEAYLDVTGLGDAQEIAASIRTEIEAATGCTASAGIGPNLLLARIATEHAKPNGQLMVTQAQAREYLQALPVNAFPGVGYQTEQKLAAKGIATAADVLARSKEWLQSELGPKLGAQLWDYARGRDDRRVEPPKPRKSVGAEVNYAVRFRSDEDAHKLLDDIAADVEKRMQQAGVKGRTLTLKLMRRKQGAPEPIKFLGHGPCDNLSRSVTLARFTASAPAIAAECKELLKTLRVPCADIRGMGIQVTRLDNDASSASARPGGLAPAKLVAPPATRVGDADMQGPWAGFFAKQQQQQQEQPEQQEQQEQQSGHEPPPGAGADAAVRSPPHAALAQQHHQQEQQRVSSPAAAARPPLEHTSAEGPTPQAPSGRQALVQQWQGTSLSQMDASVLAALPWSVQRELVGRLPGGRQAPGEAAPAPAEKRQLFLEDRQQQQHKRQHADSSDDDAELEADLSQETSPRSPGRPSSSAAVPSAGGGGGAAAAAAAGEPGGASPAAVGCSSGGGSGTPIVALPALSQLDPSVLDALPLAMRWELEQAYGIGPRRPQPAASRGRGGGRAAAPPRQVSKRQRLDSFVSHPPPFGLTAAGRTAAERRQQQEARQEAVRLSLSQVDPAVLAELPAELRQEVVQELHGRPGMRGAQPQRPSRLGRQPAEEPPWPVRLLPEAAAAEAAPAAAAAKETVEPAEPAQQEDGSPQHAAEPLPAAVQRFEALAAAPPAAGSAASLAAALAECLEQLLDLPAAGNSASPSQPSPRTSPGGSRGRSRGTQHGEDAEENWGSSGMEEDLPPTQVIEAEGGPEQPPSSTAAPGEPAPAAGRPAAAQPEPPPDQGAGPPRSPARAAGPCSRSSLHALGAALQRTALAFLSAGDLEQLRTLLLAVQRLGRRHPWFAAGAGDAACEAAQRRVAAEYGWRLRLGPGLFEDASPVGGM